jgi:hypothetical protein
MPVPASPPTPPPDPVDPQAPAIPDGPTLPPEIAATLVHRMSVAVPTPEGTFKVFRFERPLRVSETSEPLVTLAIQTLTQPPTVEAMQRVVAEVIDLGQRMAQARIAGRADEAHYWEQVRDYRLAMLQRWHGPAQPPVRPSLPPVRPARSSARPGRPQGSYSVPDVKRLQDMRYARDLLRTRGETVTQGRLMRVMGVAGETRRVRDWLERVEMTWKKFVREGL